MNESLYLFADNNYTILINILVRQFLVKNEIEKNKIDYVYYADIYKQFICLVAKLIEELGLKNNSFSYSYLVAKLIHKGYLSNGFQFVVDEENSLSLFGFQGIDVALGSGCCRNTSSIHENIFNTLNLPGDVIPCVSQNDLYLSAAYQTNPNHALNLLKYDGVYYAHDTLNQIFYKFKDYFTMEKYDDFSDSPQNVYYKPSADMMYNVISYRDCLNRIEAFRQSSTESHINESELNEILKQTDAEFDRKHATIVDFLHESKKYTKELVKIANFK